MVRSTFPYCDRFAGGANHPRTDFTTTIAEEQSRMSLTPNDRAAQQKLQRDERRYRVTYDELPCPYLLETSAPINRTRVVARFASESDALFCRDALTRRDDLLSGCSLLTSAGI